MLTAHVSLERFPSLDVIQGCSHKQNLCVEAVEQQFQIQMDKTKF